VVSEKLTEALMDTGSEMLMKLSEEEVKTVKAGNFS